MKNVLLPLALTVGFSVAACGDRDRQPGAAAPEVPVTGAPLTPVFSAGSSQYQIEGQLMSISSPAGAGSSTQYNLQIGQQDSGETN